MNKTSNDVTSVRHLLPLCTLTFVIYKSAKIELGNGWLTCKERHNCGIIKNKGPSTKTVLLTVRFLTATSIAKDHDDRSTSNKTFINTPGITWDISTEYGDPNQSKCSA